MIVKILFNILIVLVLLEKKRDDHCVFKEGVGANRS